MAKIYAKPTDQTLILSVREFMLRQFDLGTWTEIRMGAFFNGTDAANDNSQPSSETATLNTAVDRFAFGLKNSATASIPGQTGSNFMGWGNASDIDFNNNATFSLRIRQTSGSLNALISSVDTTVTSRGTFPSVDMPYAMTASSNYNTFLGIKFTVSNRGLSSQQVVMQTCATNTFNSSTYNLTELRNAITTFASPGTATAAFAWNNGATAYALPDCYFVRWPFTGARCRMSAIDVVRIS